MLVPAGAAVARVSAATPAPVPVAPDAPAVPTTAPAAPPAPPRVLRPSRVLTPLCVSTGIPAGAVTGVVVCALRIEHRDIKTHRWIPSQLAPARVEVLAAGRWTPIVTWTTDTTGAARGTVTLPWGIYMLRVVRPAGDTVTAATAAAVRVEVVPGGAGPSVLA